MRNSIIRAVPCVRFLGILFQNNLKWNSHVNKVVASCSKPLAILSFLRTTWWGSDPSLLLMLYKGLIRSRMEYGAFVWFNLPQYLTRKLEMIQFQACRTALGYRKTTPINVILYEAREPPLRARFEFLGYNYISRTLACSNHVLIPIMDNIRNFMDCPTNVLRSPPPFLYECYIACSRFSHLIETSEHPLYCDFPFSVLSFSPRVLLDEGSTIRDDLDPPACFNRMFPPALDESRFFTNGSKTPNRPFAGFAVVNVSEHRTFRFRTSSEASIFTCEAMAILLALRIASDSPHHIVSIFSDSKSVLRALLPSKKNRKKAPSLILKILQILEELKHKGRDVSLIWIPAHLNITGNEQADCAAKEAVATGIDSDLLLPPSDFSALWRDRMYCELFEWAENRGLSKGSYFFSRFSTRCRKPWFHKFKFKRKSVVSINRLRSGHTTLAECLFNHKIIDSPLCECGDIQSPNHIIWQCEHLNGQREKLLQTLSAQGLMGPFCIEQFLHIMNPDIIFALASFIDTIPTRI